MRLNFCEKLGRRSIVNILGFFIYDTRYSAVLFKHEKVFFVFIFVYSSLWKYVRNRQHTVS